MKLLKLDIALDPERPEDTQLYCNCYFDNGAIHATRGPAPSNPKEFRSFMQYITSHMSDWYEQHNEDFE